MWTYGSLSYSNHHIKVLSLGWMLASKSFQILRRVHILEFLQHRPWRGDPGINIVLLCCSCFIESHSPVCRQSSHHFTDCGLPFVVTTVLGIHKSLITTYWVGTGRMSYLCWTSFPGSSRALRLISTGCKSVMRYHWGWRPGHVALRFCCSLD